MKIKFIGTGSAFTMKSFQSNIVITENDRNLLFDAGGDVRFALDEQGMSYKDINAMYLSHQHADHIGGVEYVAFCSHFDPSVEHKVQLFGNSKLLRDSWKNSLKGGLESIQGKVFALEDYFDVSMIPENGKFIWEDNIFETVQAVHIMNGRSIVPTYGLMITAKSGKKVYLTGDTQYCPNQIMDFYKEADVIIQDCETYPFKSGVHANYEDLKTLPVDIKAKMHLVHMNDNIFQDTKNIVSSEIKSYIDTWETSDGLNLNDMLKHFNKFNRVLSYEWANKVKVDGFASITQLGDELEV